MADLTVSDYNDSNRAFLQALLARNVLTLETAKPLLAAILSVHENKEVAANDITQEDFNSYISKTNTALSPLDLEIRNSFHQTTRERIYALVNTTSDPLTQLATTYSADEIAFVKRLLDAMFDGSANTRKREAMCISTMEAVQLVRGGNRRDTQNGTSQTANSNMKMVDVEKMLENLRNEGWLEKSRAGYHTLSPRALMELKGWLVETYNEPAEEDEDQGRRNKIKFCHACKELNTMGQRCSNRDCPCRLHDICTQNFFRIHRSQRCPLCKTAWDGKSYVGERAITTSDSYRKGKSRSTQQEAAEGDAGEDDET